MSPSVEAILKEWKKAGGYYKQAAEELEKELEEEERKHGDE